MLIAKAAWQKTLNFPLNKCFTLKSDRINALRKQYDAFLEDEKKRKERNEFILGRLQEMRYCSTSINTQYKPNITPHIQVPFNHESCHSVNLVTTKGERSCFTRPHLILDQQDNFKLEETVFLEELKKKYIIIPKIQTTMFNGYNNLKQEIEGIPDKGDNSDWKTKYDILNKLKKDEEELARENNSFIKSHVKTDEEFANYPSYDTGNNEIKNDVLLEYRQDTPEQHISDRKLSSDLLVTEKYEINKNSDEVNNKNDFNNDTAYYNANNYDSQNNLEVRFSNLNLNDNSEIINIPKTEYTKHFETGILTSDKKSHLYDYPLPENQVQIATDIDAPELKNNTINPEFESVSHFNNDVTSIDLIRPDDITKEIKNVTETDTTFPIDIINTKEYTPNDNEKLEDGIIDNPDDNKVLIKSTIDLNDQSNTISENSVAQEQIENAIDDADIEAFNTEQREMFYSEKGDVYDPAAENSNTDYVQDQNYDQDGQYVYYEGQSQQPFTAEFNEHEETSQSYDTNYEQQYAYEQENYDQQNLLHNEQVYDQQFEPHENKSEQYEQYNNTEPEYTTLQNEQQSVETEKYIEQQLDNEQGYTEKQNEEDTEIDKSDMKQSEHTA